MRCPGNHKRINRQPLRNGQRELKDYCRGLYGRPPGPIDPTLLEKALGDEKPAFIRPGDQLAPGMDTARAEVGSLARTEEDIVTYALFPAMPQIF